MDNLLEQVTDKINFNPQVHEATKDGDPLRNEDGTIRLKKNWKTEAVDRQGRKFNPKVHGNDQELDSEGYLKVRRRESKGVLGSTNRTEAFVAKYKEAGYAYRPVNDEGGRVEQFVQNDWEPVVDKKGRAEMPVGQARSPGTKAVLMRKPIEWYEADQKLKQVRRAAAFKQKTAPKEEQGQYEVKSPLR